MDDNKSNSQISVPGVASTMLAQGVFIYSNNPFNPARPGVLSGFNSNAEDIRARLWQDPFEAVIEHKKTKHKADEVAGAPISKHPIFSAIAMPFGGVGGLYLIDYVANIGI